MDKYQRAVEEPRALLRTPDAAKRLGCAKQTLERWRTEGVGPKFVRLSPKIVAYDPSDLAAFVEARKVSSTSEPAAR
jgi:predicted DNA-binding transcriptional regulator AlpA